MSADTNRAIELHDSTLVRLDHDGTDLVLELAAYVHASSGTPGVDEGSGWSQTAAMRVHGARRPHRKSPAAPISIADGSLTVDNRRFDNLLPAPLVAIGQTTLQLATSDGPLALEGCGITIELTGPPTFIETFAPGA